MRKQSWIFYGFVLLFRSSRILTEIDHKPATLRYCKAYLERQPQEEVQFTDKYEQCV